MGDERHQEILSKRRFRLDVLYNVWAKGVRVIERKKEEEKTRQKREDEPKNESDGKHKATQETNLSAGTKLVTKTCVAPAGNWREVQGQNANYQGSRQHNDSITSFASAMKDMTGYTNSVVACAKKMERVK